MNLSLFLCVPWEASTAGTGFALGVVCSACLPLGLSCVASRSWQQPFWSGGTRRHSPQQAGLWLNTLPECGQTRPWGWQNCSFQILSQTDLHPTKFHGQCVPSNLVLQMSKAASWDCTWALNLWTCSTKIYVPVVASPSPLLHHSESPSGYALQISLPSLWCVIRVGAPATWPTVLRCEGLVVPSRLSFPTEGSRSSGEISMHGAMLSWEKDFLCLLLYFQYLKNRTWHMVKLRWPPVFSYCTSSEGVYFPIP